MVPPVSSSWQRIDAWLATHAPASLALLNPPVTEEDLESAQRVVGVDFPAELSESLRCHDGLKRWTNLMPDKPPLSARDIAQLWEECMEIQQDLGEDTDRNADGSPAQEPWWHPLWIPWAELDGDAQVIDLRPGAGYGRLGMTFHDDCGVSPGSSWSGLAAYLHDVARALHLGGGVRGGYPFLMATGELWWDLGTSSSLHGVPLVPAPVGL
jgi:cell wall assembly regulator SMI1